MDQNQKLSRRKLLATMSIAGATAVTGSMMQPFASGNSIAHASANDGYVNVKDFGAIGDGLADDTMAIRTAILELANDGGIVLFPPGTYKVSTVANLQVTSNIRLVGSGGVVASVIRCNGQLTTPIFNTIGDHIMFEGLDIQSPNTTNAVALINISGGSNITVHQCTLDGGHTAIRLNPRDNEIIKEIKITDNLIKRFNFGIYIGSHHNFPIGGSIHDVMIDRNVIIEGIQIGQGGDGIKTVQRCHTLLITNNNISGYSRDGVDLFASGDTVIVSGNIINDNLVKGIDIKSDLANYPESKFGFNGRRITITNNIIDGNKLVGVAIAQNINNGDYTYLIDVSHNQISRSVQSGITISGRFMTVSDNMIFENCLADANYPAIRVGRNLQTVLTSDISFINNTIVNNGSDEADVHGIYIGAYCENCLIQGNIIKNDLNLPNPKQKKGLYVNQQTKNIVVRDNQIADHLTHEITIVNGADIRGECVHIQIGDLEAGSTGEIPLFSVPKDGALVRAALVTSNSILANSTDYIVLSLRKRNGTTSPLTFTNYSTASTAVPPFETAPFPRIRNNTFLRDDVITVNITKAGAGQAIKNGYILLEYVEF